MASAELRMVVVQASRLQSLSTIGRNFVTPGLVKVDFAQVLHSHGLDALRRGVPRTLQVNVGKRCNQACHHCHVDAGPKRTEMMDESTARRVVELLAANPPVETLDLTGGAPELNPHFAFLVEQARRLGRRVIVRCNLTVLLVAGMEHLPALYRDNQVELVCSLPCYSADNVDRQRGNGVFQQSIAALQLLNELGYGRPASPLSLNLVYNPQGGSLPPPQAQLEARYREVLRGQFGVEFHQLLTITNMPIKRFAAQLERSGEHDAYLGLLVNHFNAQTLPGLMCRNLLSVGWNGTLYDCDFNQMLEMPLGASATAEPLTLWDIDDLDQLNGRHIRTARHCFGCTAGAGSGCGGALQ
jgi:radical SAM/Cys-rich protein